MTDRALPDRSGARLVAPADPAEAPPPRFPWVMVLAPVAVAVVLWLVTHSAYALIFAGLGPVTAIASVVDGRLSARRLRRREAARWAGELAALSRAIDEVQEAERDERRLEVPSAIEVVRQGVPAGSGMRLGLGRIPIDLDISGAERSTRPEVRALADRAAVLEAAPILCADTDGVGIVGPPTVGRALQRSLLVSGPGSSARVVTATSARQLPVGLAVELCVSEGVVTVTRHPSRRARGVGLHPELVSQQEVESWRAGSPTADPDDLPSTVALGSLLAAPDRTASGPGLACWPAADAGGPVLIDLVSDGPHAVVGGTTGSGKSELLIAWLVAMACAHPPHELALLLIDFKGGATFEPLGVLPHTVGIITDLDHGGAARALASLGAEIRHREQALAAQGLRQIEGSDLPRLVIVVDEYAAMLEQHPGLPALFADLAARGRSLGIHLILATQRPAGVVRESVMANADLRLSLRVNNAADSVAVVGVPDAAGIAASHRGRALLRAAGRETVAVQFGLASTADIAAVASAHPDAVRPRRPWCPPLPTRLHLDTLPPEHGIVFGLADEPHHQRQVAASWTAQTALVVVGAARSGLTTSLVTIAAAATRAGRRPLWIPRAPDAAWDAIEALVAELDSADLNSADLNLADRADRGCVVLLDDLDVLLARFAGEHRAAVADGLARLLREGPARGIVVVASAQRISGEVAMLTATVTQRLLLRQPNRQEHVVAGGDGGDFDAALAPGGGWWNGCRVQVAQTDDDRPADAGARIVDLAPARPLAIVSSRATALAGRLSGRVIPVAQWSGERVAEPGDILLGDPDDWQSRWGLLSAIREQADLILDDCSLADVRVLTRSRRLPPPLSPGLGLAWRYGADGGFDRVRLPWAAAR